MLLSARESARVLSEAGIARAQARVLLAAGLAGRPVQTLAATLYDGAAVRGLAERPTVDPHTVARACPHGLYVARLRPARPIDARPTDARPIDDVTGWQDLAAQLRHQPAMPSWSRALVAARIAAHGTLPWVATLCGHVVLGADATRIHAAPDGGPDGETVFELSPPGTWFDELRDRVLPTARGGRPWVLWTPRSLRPDPSR